MPPPPPFSVEKKTLITDIYTIFNNYRVSLDKFVMGQVCPKFGHPFQSSVKLKSLFMQVKNNFAKIVNKFLVLKLFHSALKSYFLVACPQQLQIVCLFLKYLTFGMGSELRAPYIETKILQELKSFLHFVGSSFTQFMLFFEDLR